MTRKPVIPERQRYRVTEQSLNPRRKYLLSRKPTFWLSAAGRRGVAAALSASRAGAATVLVERYNHLGGLWTGGLVLPLLSTHAADKNNTFKKVIYGIGDEIAAAVEEDGYGDS